MLALNAATVSASVTLALMTNQLVRSESNFLALLGQAYVVYLVLNYIIAKSHKTNPENDFVYSSVLSSIIIHHSFSEFRKRDIDLCIK